MYNRSLFSLLLWQNAVNDNDSDDDGGFRDVLYVGAFCRLLTLSGFISFTQLTISFVVALKASPKKLWLYKTITRREISFAFGYDEFLHGLRPKLLWETFRDRMRCFFVRCIKSMYI